MTRKLIASSNLVSVGYDSETKQLDIEFKGGAVYRYNSVPEHVYQGLVNAPSAGSYHHANIKSVYSFVKL
jgi:hypothetical protein